MPSTAGRIVALEGVSGVGKTTLMAGLSARVSAVALPEAFDRLGRSVPLEFTDERSLSRIERLLLEEEARRYALARRETARGFHVVADTGFLGPLTYTLGLGTDVPFAPRVATRLLARARQLGAGARWGIPDVTLVLDVSRRTAERRARGAPDHDEPLRARHLEVGQRELNLWRTKLAPTVRGRVRWVSARGSKGTVVSRVAGEWKRLVQVGPASATEAKRLLRAYESVLSATVKKRTRPPAPLADEAP